MLKLLLPMLLIMTAGCHSGENGSYAQVGIVKDLGTSVSVVLNTLLLLAVILILLHIQHKVEEIRDLTKDIRNVFPAWQEHLRDVEETRQKMSEGFRARRSVVRRSRVNPRNWF